MLVQDLAGNGPVTIGGGTGWYKTQVTLAAQRLQQVLTVIQAPTQPAPGVAPHPREAALAAAREAVIHLTEVLNVEAPHDAVEETRLALEAMQGAVTHLENMPADQTDLLRPTVNFERAIGFLQRAAQHLTDPGGRPLAPGGNGDVNGGVVPPWLGTEQPGAGDTPPDTFLPLPGPGQGFGG